MEKIITIGGKDVKLKSNAMQLLIFRDNFGRDMLEVQSSLMKLINISRTGEITVNLDGIKYVDSLGIVQIIWTMAKAADPETPPLEQWLDEFEAFPIMEVFMDAYDLILSNFVTTSKIKNAKAAGTLPRKG